MSETTGKLAEALAAAQGEMRPAEMDKVNPHFRNKYASLASIMASVRQPLAKRGLAVVQELMSVESGVQCTTRVLHSSGESLSSVFWMPVKGQTAQEYGSASTYARRYSLCAMLGVVADEDDDGEGATAGPTPRRAPRTESRKEAPAPEPLPAEVANDFSGVSSHELREKKEKLAKWLQANPRSQKGAQAQSRLDAVVAELARRATADEAAIDANVVPPDADYRKGGPAPGSNWTGD